MEVKDQDTLLYYMMILQDFYDMFNKANRSLEQKMMMFYATQCKFQSQSTLTLHKYRLQLFKTRTMKLWKDAA